MTMLDVGLRKQMGGVKGNESISHSSTGKLYERPWNRDAVIRTLNRENRPSFVVGSKLRLTFILDRQVTDELQQVFLRVVGKR